jgi:hypothetical protein
LNVANLIFLIDFVPPARDQTPAHWHKLALTVVLNNRIYRIGGTDVVAHLVFRAGWSSVSP